jgi:hypothetical protein
VALAQPFFDREQQLGQLDAAWSAPGAQLITLWGRRRVGKSALLAQFAAGKKAVYLYGKRVTEQDILTELTLQIAAAFDEPHLRLTPLPNWRIALDYLASRLGTVRTLIVFDEFPYLCEVSQGLDTLVQHWWDRIHAGGDVMVVLAGSGLSFMQGLTGVRGALHGRRTGQLAVPPFDYLDASQFFPELSPDERVRAYSCLGGIPAYLRHWRAGETLRANAEATLLAPGHFLFREGEELLRTEFHQETLYASILRAVAAGEERPSDIAQAVGRQSAAEIFGHLQRLQELQFLRREIPITEWDRSRTHRALYRLADPYLRFWFRFVFPYQSFLQLGRAETVWEREIAPHLDEFVARTTWEEVIVQHLWRRLASDRVGARWTHLGRWWDNQDEIDLVGLWRNEVTLVGECKWTAVPVDERVFTALRRKAAKLPLVHEPLWVLASRSGFDRRLRERAERGDVLLLEPTDLFS